MLSVAACQLDVFPNDLTQNLQLIEKMITNASSENIDFLVFPELLTLGYDLNAYSHLSRNNFAVITEKLSDLANQFKMSILLGTHTESEGVLRNSQVLFSPSAKPHHVYEKAHLFPGEEPFFESGTTDENFFVNDIHFRAKICYDLRFPECFRIYESVMPHVFVISAAWPLARISHWKTLLQARAIENQAYIVASNRIGNDNGLVFGGTSLIINPLGEIIAESSEDKEEIISTVIDSDSIEKLRKDFAVLKHMKFRVYSLNE